jgi:hypothetical protein
MYSFAQNEGVAVIDEPLYGHYLRVTGAEHPGHEEVIAAMNCDGDAVMRELLLRQAENPEPRLFVKHMAHHLVDLDLGFLRQTCNVFLIRDPRDMLPSLSIQLPEPCLADTGLRRQWELFSGLRAAGQEPVILDSRELLSDPRHVLSTLCQRIGIVFTPAMLSWEPGPRPEDGVWAPHWYHAVHRSTGFAPYRAKTEFPDRLKPLLEECEPWYEKLFQHAIRADAEGARN